VLRSPALLVRSLPRRPQLLRGQESRVERQAQARRRRHPRRPRVLAAAPVSSSQRGEETARSYVERAGGCCPERGSRSLASTASTARASSATMCLWASL